MRTEDSPRAHTRLHSELAALTPDFLAAIARHLDSQLALLEFLASAPPAAQEEGALLRCIDDSEVTAHGLKEVLAVIAQEEAFEGRSSVEQLLEKLRQKAALQQRIRSATTGGSM